MYMQSIIVQNEIIAFRNWQLITRMHQPARADHTLRMTERLDDVIRQRVIDPVIIGFEDSRCTKL